MSGGGGVVPSDCLVSTQLQLCLFCCWGYGCCWAMTIFEKREKIKASLKCEDSGIDNGIILSRKSLQRYFQIYTCG